MKLYRVRTEATKDQSSPEPVEMVVAKDLHTVVTAYPEAVYIEYQYEVAVVGSPNEREE